MLEWISGQTAFSNPQVAQDPVLTAASKAVAGLRLRISLNADGEFAGLANQNEVVPKLQAAVDAMTGELSAKLTESQRKGFLGLVKSILSPAALISAATNDVQAYFGLNGIAISVGEAIETTIQQPNPLGGAALPATFQIRAESATSDSAVLSTKTIYGPAALRELMRALFAQAGKPMPPGELDKLPPWKWGTTAGLSTKDPSG